MADRDLELALRIRADIEQGRKALQSVEKQLDSLGDAAKRTNGKLSSVDVAKGAAEQAAKIEKTNAGLKDTAKHLDTVEKASKKAGKALGDAIGKLATGNAAGASDALASSAAKGALSFGAYGIAIGGAVAVIGLFASAVFKGYEEQLRFEKALIETGNIAGTTAGHLAEITNQVGAATGKYGDAEVAVTLLAKSGKVAAESLATATKAAVDLATLTGDSIESTTAKIIKLADAPSATLVELNNQYHFLTDEVYNHVKALEAQGNAEGAAKVAMEALAESSKQRVKEMADDAGYLVTAWNKVKTAVLGAWQAIKDLGRTDAAADLAGQSRALAAYNEELKGVIRSGASDEVLAFHAKQVRVQTEVVNALLKTRDAKNADAKATSDAQKTRAEAFKASQSIEKQLEDGLDRQAKKQKALNDLLAQYNAIARGNPEDSRLSDGSYDKIRASIEERFKEPKTRTPKTPRTPAAKTTDAERADAAAQREIDNLQKQIALTDQLADGETKISNVARVRYEIESGIFKLSSDASKKTLLARAEEADKQAEANKAAAEHKKEVEDTTRAYERLHDELRTPVEVNLDKALSDLGVLNKALVLAIENKDLLSQGKILDDIGRLQQKTLFGAGEPDGVPRPSNTVGDQFGRLAVAQAAEQADYQTRLKQLADFRETKKQSIEQYDADEERIEAEHRDRMARIDQTRGQLALQTASNIFGSLAQLQYSHNAKAARIGKAAAIAQAIINTYQSATGAYNAMVNIPYIGPALGIAAAAAAIAAGLANVAAIRSQPTSFAGGGFTGRGGKYEYAGDVHKGEGVLNQQEIGALGGEGGFYALRDAIASGDISRFNLAPAAPRALPSPRYSFADGGYASGKDSAGGAPRGTGDVYVLMDANELSQHVTATSDFRKGTLDTVAQNPAKFRQALGIGG